MKHKKEINFYQQVKKINYNKQKQQMNKVKRLISPSMIAFTIGTYIVQLHFFFSTTTLSLKEYSLLILTFWTYMIICFWKSWIIYNISNNLSKFTIKKIVYLTTFKEQNLLNFMHQFVNINAWIFSIFTMITISACIH